MATLDEVISQMSEEDYFSDPIQFIIDSDLRIVSVPDRGVVAGVVGDKNVNRINFQMPRYYNGFDMSKFKTRINYVNANGNPNYYTVTDSTIKNDLLIFSWLVDADVVAYVGTVAFSVNMVFTDENGVTKQAFNTSDAGRLKVLEGIKVVDYVSPEEQQSVLEKLEAEVSNYLSGQLDNAKTDISKTAKSEVDINIANAVARVEAEGDKQIQRINEATSFAKGPKGDKGSTFTPSVDAEGNLSWSNADGLANPETVNIRGPKGTIFTPSVDAEGNLSWSNADGLPNPETVNIKGPKGEGGTGGTANIPEWAQQPNKPTYTASEVGALPKDTVIPSKTSELANDSDYVTRTDADETYQPKGKYLTTVPIATTERLGVIKPDGVTILIDENGVISSVGGGGGGGSAAGPNPINDLAIKNDDSSVTIYWSDSTDVEGDADSAWAGTKLVMKESDYPASVSDGKVLLNNKVRDKYKTDGYTVTGLTNGKTYYFTLFPYSVGGGYNYDSSNRITGEPASLKIVTFADGTDYEISRMIEAHYAGKINIKDYWSVGDKRTVHLLEMAAIKVEESHREQDVEFVIGDFEHDDLVTPVNGHTKAVITLLQKDCLMDAATMSKSVYGQNNSEHGYMNKTNTNVGGWTECARRIWCNNTYYNALPGWLRNLSKEVVKKTSAGNQSSTIVNTNDKVFLASEVEIFGSISCSKSGEGTQYQYYKDASANRRKNPYWSFNHNGNYYWERSPKGNTSDDFCNVDFEGGRTYDVATLYGIAPCLCI